MNMEFSVATSYAKTVKYVFGVKYIVVEKIPLIWLMRCWQGLADLGWPLGGALSSPWNLGLRLAKLYSPS